MTDAERDTANQELIGSATPIDERPDFLIEKLIELKMHVDMDQRSDKTALYEAQQRIPSVVNSTEFRLMFLRASRFDAEVSIHYNLFFCEKNYSLNNIRFASLSFTVSCSEID